LYQRVSDFLKIEITSDIYSHVTPKVIQNEQSKYEAYVGQEFIL